MGVVSIFKRRPYSIGMDHNGDYIVIRAADSAIVGELTNYDDARFLVSLFSQRLCQASLQPVAPERFPVAGCPPICDNIS